MSILQDLAEELSAKGYRTQRERDLEKRLETIAIEAIQELIRKMHHEPNLRGFLLHEDELKLHGAGFLIPGCIPDVTQPQPDKEPT